MLIETSVILQAFLAIRFFDSIALISVFARDTRQLSLSLSLSLWHYYLLTTLMSLEFYNNRQRLWNTETELKFQERCDRAFPYYGIRIRTLRTHMPSYASSWWFFFSPASSRIVTSLGPSPSLTYVSYYASVTLPNVIIVLRGRNLT